MTGFESGGREPSHDDAQPGPDPAPAGGAQPEPGIRPVPWPPDPTSPDPPTEPWAAPQTPPAAGGPQPYPTQFSPQSPPPYPPPPAGEYPLQYAGQYAGQYPPQYAGQYPPQYAGQYPPQFPPVPPRRRNRLVPILAALVGLLLVAVVAALVWGARADRRPSTAVVQQSATPLASGQTRVVDSADGLALILPSGWTQAPTSPSELLSWAKAEASKYPALQSSMNSPQVAALMNNMKVFAVYSKGTRKNFAYLMVLKLPAAIPMIDDSGLTAVESSLSGNPMFTDVRGSMITVAGQPALRVLGTEHAGAATIYCQMYMIRGRAGTGFFVYLYSATPGDPRGDLATITDSLNPNYAR